LFPLLITVTEDVSDKVGNEGGERSVGYRKAYEGKEGFGFCKRLEKKEVCEEGGCSRNDLGKKAREGSELEEAEATFELFREVDAAWVLDCHRFSEEDGH